MSDLPRDVISVQEYLSNYPSHELTYISNKLIHNNPELISMWLSFEKFKAGNDDLWVWAHLREFEKYRKLPKFHYKNKKDREILSNEIIELTKKLAIKLEANGLDTHLFHNSGILFNGFYLYEDFGESNRESIDDDPKINKVKISELLKDFAQRTQELIENEPLSGKIGKNVEAIRFIRLVINSNLLIYDDHLKKETAIATNAIFGTPYTTSDITNLLKR